MNSFYYKLSWSGYIIIPSSAEDPRDAGCQERGGWAEGEGGGGVAGVAVAVAELAHGLRALEPIRDEHRDPATNHSSPRTASRWCTRPRRRSRSPAPSPCARPR